jgi:LAO/AO transport system kinase
MARDELGREAELLLKKAEKSDQMALSRLLSLVEKDLRKAAPFLAKLKARASSVRIGITGSPGAGKSSLINCLVKIYRGQNLKVAILAIDPSSPFSGGAILGDRVRMTSHSEDKNVFIRSLGSRGALGGLSVATGAMAAVLEATGFDVIIIETVGVGQTELQVMNLADATCVVLVPESGDVIQTLKAGILEIADLFVVNKSDRSGAETLANELKALVDMEGERKRDVLLTSATKNEGTETLSEVLLADAKKLKSSRRNSPERLTRELQNLVLWSLQENLQPKISKIKISNIYSAFQKFKLPK